MGEFNLESSTWISDCKNRAKNTECQHCNCCNKAIAEKRGKVLNKDVEETLCWGIDLYTRKNIIHILPEIIHEDLRF